MFAAFTEIVRKEIANPKQFQAYREDSAIRRATAERAAVGNFVISIGDLCGLTSKQLTQLTELGTKLYRQGRFGNGMLAGDRIPQGISEADLEGILKPSQLAFFRKRSSSALSRRTEFRREERRQELTSALRNIAEAKIDLLDSEFSISETQRKRLQLLSKRVLTGVIGKRLEAEKDFAAFSANPNSEPDMEMIQTARMTHSQLFESMADTWEKSVASTLDAKQRELFEEASQKRRTLAWQTMHSQLFFRMADQIKLTGRQQDSIRKLVLAKVKPPRRVKSLESIDMMRAFKPMLDIPDESFEAILNDDQLKRFTAQQEQLRQLFERLEKE